jgi:hypothetical protein
LLSEGGEMMRITKKKMSLAAPVKNWNQLLAK